MIIIPEIQLQGGKVVSRSTVVGSSTIHDITPQDAVARFSEAGVELIQIVDVDAARSQDTNNQKLVCELIESTDVPIQVAGGIRTLAQINDWFENGAARVVLGTVAITDAPLVQEAANRHPGGIVVHLSTRDGYVMTDGWKNQTAFRPEDLAHDLQMTGIAGIVHKGTEYVGTVDPEALALTEALSHDLAIPVFASGMVKTLDDISTLRFIPNVNGAVISHALLSGAIDIHDALQVAAQQEVNPEPESVTHNIETGAHHGIRAYLAAYNTSQAARLWNLALRQTIVEDNPYMEVLIPQEDLDLNIDGMSMREVQAAYETELNRAEVVIVILEGVESKGWTGFELGFARANGKYIYGIASSDVSLGHSQQRLAAMCDEIIYFSKSDDANTTHAEISHALAARVMIQNQAAGDD